MKPQGTRIKDIVNNFGKIVNNFTLKYLSPTLILIIFIYK